MLLYTNALLMAITVAAGALVPRGNQGLPVNGVTRLQELRKYMLAECNKATTYFELD